MPNEGTWSFSQPFAGPFYSCRRFSGRRDLILLVTLTCMHLHRCGPFLPDGRALLTMQVLVEGPSRKSSAQLVGKTCTGKRVVLQQAQTSSCYTAAGGSITDLQTGSHTDLQIKARPPTLHGSWHDSHQNSQNQPWARQPTSSADAQQAWLHQQGRMAQPSNGAWPPQHSPAIYAGTSNAVDIQAGQYVAVQVTQASGSALLGQPLGVTTLTDFVAVHSSTAGGMNLSGVNIRQVVSSRQKAFA